MKMLKAAVRDLYFLKIHNIKKKRLALAAAGGLLEIV